MRILVGLGVASAASVALAQAPAPQVPPQFRASIDLMRTELTVLDKRTRKPIRGLTAADFIIKVNGQPQPIEAFDEVEVPGVDAAGRPAFMEAQRDIASNTLASPRLFMIVMDDALAPRDQFHKKKGIAIANAVVDRLGPRDMAAIVFAQDNRHAQDFTQDRAALRKAISTYQPRPLDPIMARVMSIGVLERSSTFLRKMSGYRRAIVWITLGPGGAPSLEEEGLVTWESGPLSGVDVTSGEGEYAVARAANRMINGGRIAPVPIYPYSTQGLEPVTVNEIRGGRMPSLFGDEVLNNVAAATGGRVVQRTNAPELDVPSMFAELSSYYALAFRSTFPMDGKLRWLQVEVNRPNAIVIPPDTSFATPRDARDIRPTRRATQPTGLLEALSGPLPSGEVRLVLGSVPLAVPASKEHLMALTLGIPVTAAGTPHQFDVSVLVYDAEGLREVVSQRQTVTSKPRASEADSLVEVVLPLSLRPGRYQARVAVTDSATGKAGSVFSTLTVPDFVKERLSMSGVAIGRAESPPIAGRETVQALLPFAPTVVREFAVSDRVGALVRMHQAAGRRVDLRVEKQILDAAGAIVSSDSATLPASAFLDERGSEVRYDLPLRRLSPGEYLLRIVAATEGARSDRVTREVRFSIK